jgi:hypothetical protein
VIELETESESIKDKSEKEKRLVKPGEGTQVIERRKEKRVNGEEI